MCGMLSQNQPVIMMRMTTQKCSTPDPIQNKHFPENLCRVRKISQTEVYLVSDRATAGFTNRHLVCLITQPVRLCNLLQEIKDCLLSLRWPSKRVMKTKSWRKLQTSQSTAQFNSDNIRWYDEKYSDEASELGIVGNCTTPTAYKVRVGRPLTAGSRNSRFTPPLDNLIA